MLEIVAEKTGYPKDMLDLDLDLEADLGVDTVKQAEMFAAVRAAYNIPRDENLKLRDFPTLAHVIRFARTGSLVCPKRLLEALRRCKRNQKRRRNQRHLHLRLRSRLPLRVRLQPVSTPPIVFRAAYLFPTCARHLPSASQLV